MQTLTWLAHDIYIEKRPCLLIVNHINLSQLLPWMVISGWLVDYRWWLSCDIMCIYIYIDLYIKLYKLYKLYMYTTTIMWFFMIFNTIQPIQWANGSCFDRFAHGEFNPEATEKLQSTLRDLEAAKAQLEAWFGSERGSEKPQIHTDPTGAHLRKPSVLQHLSGWSSTGFKWQNVYRDALICFDFYCIWCYREIISEAMLNSLASLDAKHPVMFVPFGWPTVMNGLPAFLFRLSKNFSDPPKASKIWHGALAPWPLLRQKETSWKRMQLMEIRPPDIEILWNPRILVLWNLNVLDIRRNKKNKKTCFQRPLIKS